jgi:ABC-2 type transport system ATP-binding protein
VPSLEARNLSKQYGENRALDRLNLSIEPGEIYCLLGPNGAGKTTTINLFLNFIAPTEGSAIIKGLDVATHALETKRHLAYIPEQVSLYRNLTGLENLRFFSALAGRRDEGDAALERVLRDVGLAAEAAHRRVGTYSKGMRQKVGLAMAIARHADVLLLDEPTSGLDPTAAREFATLLERMRAAGAAVLMTTHDLFRAKASGTHIGIMRGGRLLTSMRASEIDHHELEDVYLTHVASDDVAG